MEEEVKSPFAYLLVAMNYAKAAVENGGKVDMFNVHSLMDFGYGEGEMFFRDFLAQFGKVDDWAINDEESNPEKWKPVYFEVNERGRALGQKAIELEQQFKDQLIPEDKMLSLSQGYSDAVGILRGIEWER